MIEITPQAVDSAFFYFHSAHSSSQEIVPFLDQLQAELPTTYIWAGDGPIEGSSPPLMRHAVTYGTGPHRFWFVFPMQGNYYQDFVEAKEAMGAVLVSCGGFANALVDQIMLRYGLPAKRVVLCGHQHGACIALAAAMMRRSDPFQLSVLFDPWPAEAYYFAHEADLPPTRVVCVDNRWVKERQRQSGMESDLYQVFQGYGMNAEGVTLPQGENKPEASMFSEAIRQIKSHLLST